MKISIIGTAGIPARYGGLKRWLKIWFFKYTKHPKCDILEKYGE